MRVDLRSRIGVGILTGFLLAPVLAPPGVLGQETGRVVGSVRDAGSLQPLQGVNVYIPGSSIGVVTNAEGAFLMLNVPAGEVTVRAERIGYGSAERTVTLTAGQSLSLDFSLETSALALDELVVTATGVQRKIEIGNAVATINAAAEVAERPLSDISNLLTGRTTGVQVQTGSGSTGMGSRIRIRGANSASLSNEPVIYVDGVRIDNDPRSISFETGGQSPSRFNDINPEDIETIEIIKGPSAATLYGSIAANGVIRITTKRGRSGSARWTAYVEGGQVNDVGVYPANYRAEDAAGNVCPLFDQVDPTIACTPSRVLSYQALNDPANSPFRSGTQRRAGVSVAGGSDVFTYFISGNFKQDDGVTPINDTKNYTLRGNFGAQVSEDLNFRFSTGYLSSNLHLPLNDNFALGLMGQGLNGFATPAQNNGWGEFTPAELFTIETHQNVERFTTGVETSWQLAEALELRGSAGLDFSSRLDSQFFPTGEAPAFLNFDQGARFSNRFQTFNYTADLGGSYRAALTSSIGSRTSAGFQFLRSMRQGTLATGLQLVAGSSSIAGAAVTTSTEQTLEQRTAGVFLEEQLDFNGTLFVTAAVRADKGSAFGSDLSAVIYPKLSASWVLSDKDFVANLGWLSSLRLRGAWGDSGVQPGTNDALRFFLPVAVATGGTNVTGVTFGGVGNPDLKPERSREYEFGVDAELYGSRLGVELTYFDKRTKDALVLRQLPPSLGVGNGRFENLGSVRNSGLEAGLSMRVIESSSVAFDLDVVGSFLSNELLELGEGIPPVVFGMQRHQVGSELGAYYDEPFTFNDANGDGIIGKDEVQVGDTAVYLGAPFAKRDISFRAGLNLFDNRVNVTGLLSYRGGQMLNNGTGSWRNGNTNTRELNDPTASLENQARAIASKFLGTNAGYVEDASFWRLREVAVTLNAPSTWAGPIGAQRLSLTVSGRNLGLWTDYSGLDPEIISSGQSNFTTSEFLSQPPTRFWSARVNVTF
jgi:TonB-dependent starch-binding outer membrane protein SusC